MNVTVLPFAQRDVLDDVLDHISLSAVSPASRSDVISPARRGHLVVLPLDQDPALLHHAHIFGADVLQRVEGRDGK